MNNSCRKPDHSFRISPMSLPEFVFICNYLILLYRTFLTEKVCASPNAILKNPGLSTRSTGWKHRVFSLGTSLTFPSWSEISYEYMVLDAHWHTVPICKDQRSCARASVAHYIIWRRLDSNLMRKWWSGSRTSVIWNLIDSILSNNVRSSTASSTFVILTNYSHYFLK